MSILLQGVRGGDAAFPTGSLYHITQAAPQKIRALGAIESVSSGRGAGARNQPSEGISLADRRS